MAMTFPASSACTVADRNCPGRNWQDILQKGHQPRAQGIQGPAQIGLNLVRFSHAPNPKWRKKGLPEGVTMTLNRSLSPGTSRSRLFSGFLRVLTFSLITVG